MKQFFQKLKNFVLDHKKVIGIVAAAIVGLALVGLIVALFIYNSQPKVKYQPTVACELFTQDEANDLMGGEAINSVNNAPQITKNLAVSRCGYTDRLAVRDMKVAAIVVRSGINDEGVTQNKTEFANGMPQDSVEIIEDMGDAAYFNEANRQLNILDGKIWIVATFGDGGDPLSNTKEDALALGEKLVN